MARLALHDVGRHTSRLDPDPALVGWAVRSDVFDHKDPFDRLIAATALVEGLTILSSDPTFDAYGVTRIW